ncbi:hypothetical protein [Mycobacterium szulgai]|uniref:PknH-like extracellular domain-containing protein n=1 Tax=Mycobacterium szulgai TaxID=1787 RepID=A0A1X2E5U3_MYCSZ|nr:hypothetical protein [Mycobacterium szulgai]MCV7077921.1 hypothetical protein [Mycobacterium szulgai]ORW95732.1 hypothetical protein AWC27_06410 [Mycobacterium szulgai]
MLSATAGQPWPRVLAAIALAVLGACGVTVLAEPHSKAAPATLASQTDWVLATALPASADVPPDWGYSLSGRLQRAAPSANDALTPPPNPNPTAVYVPDTCGSVPKVLDHSGSALAAFVQVDRYAQLFVQDAPPPDAAATGEGREHGPNSRFAIWAVPDGPARIANYLDWLSRCGSYHVTNYFLDGRVKNQRNVTTKVEARSASGADAAVTVMRTFTTIGSRDPASTYHVAYYAVRGVLLECTMYMEGADLDVVQRLATQTVNKLRAL